MPNHVSNVLTGNAAMIEAFKGEDGSFSFNNILLQPDNIEVGACGGKHAPNVVCWYDWNTKNWGTKWDLYDANVVEDSFFFTTAWSAPIPVIQALIDFYPNQDFSFYWADEDMGYNVGGIRVAGGVVSRSRFREGSQEALAYALLIKGEDADFIMEAYGEGMLERVKSTNLEDMFK